MGGCRGGEEGFAPFHLINDTVSRSWRAEERGRHCLKSGLSLLSIVIPVRLLTAMRAASKQTVATTESALSIVESTCPLTSIVANVSCWRGV